MNLFRLIWSFVRRPKMWLAVFNGYWGAEEDVEQELEEWRQAKRTMWGD